MEENNNIEDLFKSAFEGAEMTPPSEVKSAIDDAIGFKKDRKVGFLWWIPLLAVLIIGTYYLTTLNGNESKSLESLRQVENSSKDNNVSSNSQYGEIQEEVVKESRVNSVQSNSNDSFGDSYNKNAETTSSSIQLKSSIQSKIEQTDSGVQSKYQEDDTDFQIKQSEVLAKKNNEQINKEQEDDIQIDVLSNDNTIEFDSTKLLQEYLDSSFITSENSPQDKDSTKNRSEELPELTIAEEENKSGSNTPEVTNNSRLMIGLIAGYEFQPKEYYLGAVTQSNESEMGYLNSSGFAINLEAQYAFKKNLYLLGGLGYQSLSGNYRGDKSTKDSTFYINEVVVYDTSGNAIDTNYVPSYSYQTTNEVIIQTYVSQRVVVPFAIGYSFDLSDKFGVQLTTGGALSFAKLTTTLEPNSLVSITSNRVGVDLWFRPELVYSLNKWQLVAGPQVRWNLVPTTQFNTNYKGYPLYGFNLGARFRF